MPILLPVQVNDITAEVLRTAQEAVYEYTPKQVRDVFPFVLDAMERERVDLFDPIYFGSFFTILTGKFSLPIEVLSAYAAEGDHLSARYSNEYRQGWTMPLLSEMTPHELGWAFDWTLALLQSDVPETQVRYEQELIMVCRLLAMALGKPESEAPDFEL